MRVEPGVAAERQGAAAMLKLNVPSPTFIAVSQVSFDGGTIVGSFCTVAAFEVAVAPLQPVAVNV